MKIRDITLVGVFAALLVGGQFILSGISGVEIVTALYLPFCFVFGAKRGIITAVLFSLIRCFIFGFFPTVLILYLIYYPLFALCFGLFGKRMKTRNESKKTVLKIVLLTLCAVMFTVLFTLLDDIITPLYYSFSYRAANAYFYASLSAVIPQIVCSLVSVPIMFYPLEKVMSVCKSRIMKEVR